MTPLGTLLRLMPPLLAIAAVGAGGCDKPSLPADVRGAPTTVHALRGAPQGGDKPPAGARRSAAPSFHSVYPADEPLAVVELTTGGAQASDSLPWVIGLHGLGDKPVGFAQLFANLPFQVHVYVPRALLPWGSGYDWFGVRVKGDPQALSEALETAADEVVGLIAKLATDPRNIGKPIVTGFSQGGMLSFALATQHPGTLTAALPIGGWLPPPAWPTSKPDASIPIIAFHGEADAIVPFAPTKRTIAHLEQVGFDVSLSSYPGLGHSINSSLRTAWVHALSLRVAEVRK